MNSLLGGGRLERFPASPFPLCCRGGRPNIPTEHSWRNQILTLEPFREEEKTTSGIGRLELQLRKYNRKKKRRMLGKKEQIR